MKWEKPIELRDFEESGEPIKSLTIHYTESMSHYGVLWQVVEKLARAKFAPKKEILSEWKVLLVSLRN